MKLFWRYRYKFFAYTWNHNISYFISHVVSYYEKYKKFYERVKFLFNNIFGKNKNAIFTNTQRVKEIEFKMKRLSL